MTQLDLPGPAPAHPAPRRTAEQVTRLRLLITVKTAPRPTDRSDRTVYAAGISADPDRPGWIRLAPIPISELGPAAAFGTYDIISVDARPADPDFGRESWQPVPHTLVREHHLKRWQWRQPWLDPYLGETVCREQPDGPTLALVRPRQVDGLVLAPHPDWTIEQRRRLDAYADRLDPTGHQDRGPLCAPRFTGAYRYRCAGYDCPGHQHTIADWEFAALQHRLAGLSDDRLRNALTTAFLHRICGPDRDPAFYLGRSGTRPDGYDVLGVYWPPRR
ncbi:hypothetical protein AB0J90_03875 [Micromonospora sp. NPDC049523]|uniref:hypothetical protein n=1 Tax=Micromonospora sp. NPDC049523 TaxID=3155921 RepID=UPI0034474D84